MDQSLDIDPIVTKFIREESLSTEEESALRAWIAAGQGREELLQRLRNDPAWTKENLHWHGDGTALVQRRLKDASLVVKILLFEVRQQMVEKGAVIGAAERSGHRRHAALRVLAVVHCERDLFQVILAACSISG